MSRFAIGIDLGTSNCAMASCDLTKKETAKALDVDITQLMAPGEISKKPLFPSVAYLPFENEFPQGSLDLPWGKSDFVCGEFAKNQSGKVAQRSVMSAKSWLIHSGVDRQAAILPWGTDSEKKISPVAASSAYLKHLMASWNFAHPTLPFHEQEIVLTIPASFDEGARALTLQAARDAGFNLKLLTLIEEPQAAFYDFISRNRKQLAERLKNIRLVLVVDVGGGTTDFSLVQVAMLQEGPSMKRVAVGEHLLLGGDNMDAALARVIEQKVYTDGRRFNAAQWSQAVAAARSAKEILLSSNAPAMHRVSLVLNPGKLVGSTVSVELQAADVNALLVDGFFPAVSQNDFAHSQKKTGVVELGLPYVHDPAITRHLVSFLHAHSSAAKSANVIPSQADIKELPRPDAILINGGVFNSPLLQAALIERVSALWPNEKQIPLLKHDSLDLAVSRGAAYSALARKDLGQKIGGGAPRAFYVQVAGTLEKKSGICIVPRGLEEGQSVELASRTFALTLGTPVQFQLYSSTADTLHTPGELVSMDSELFHQLPPLHAVMQGTKGKKVDVFLSAHLSEVGTLALSCVAGDERFRLEFELKGAGKSSTLHTVESMPAKFSESVTEVERVFGTKPLPVEPKDVKNLFRTLESLLGPRENWSLPVLRELFTALLSGASKRRRSGDHERIMFQLLGYSLRPGFGYPLDAWRCEEAFKLFKELLTHHQENPVWAEFFVLWRRIAPGLNEASQQEIWNFIKPHWVRKIPVPPLVFKEKVKGLVPLAQDEMLRTVASLELLPVAEKVEIGTHIVSRLINNDTKGGAWVWALGRLGARVPFTRAAHKTVSSEVAEEWISQLMKLNFSHHDSIPFALVQLARMTGDRARDVDDSSRGKVTQYLKDKMAPQHWIDLVDQVISMSVADEARALGDSLPFGLSLKE
jgi:molecular chaperone DnaK (HSP70)